MYKVSLVTDFLLLASFQDRKTVISCFQLFKEGIKKNQQREKTKATTQAASLEYLNIFRKTMGTEEVDMNLYPWVIEGYDIQKGIKYAIENSQDIGLLEYDEPLLSSIIDVSDPPHWLEKSFTDEIWNVIADPS
ncbi:13700_t:CDS:2, partial [Entrophospora sp. SA101]